MPEESTQQPEPSPIPTPPEVRSPSPVENLGKLIGTMQSAVALVLTLGAFLTATGFVVVNFYLSKFTDIHSLNVNPNQYFAAAMGLFVFIVMSSLLFSLLAESDTISDYLIKHIRIIHIHKLARQFVHLITIIFISLFAVISLTVVNLVSISSLVIIEIATFVLPILWNKRSIILRRLLKERLWLILFAAFFVFYIVVVGYLYSVFVYPKIPHYLGGGRPESLILVFKDDDTLARLGIAQDPTHPTRTQNILLLADLTDGMLVLDLSSGQVVAVKNDSILGIYDDKVNLDYLTTATPTFTPSPTLSPTATDTPTPAVTITATP